jgi:hypothetical protein
VDPITDDKDSDTQMLPEHLLYLRTIQIDLDMTAELRLTESQKLEIGKLD